MTDIDDLLKELQLEYIASIPQKIEELQILFKNKDHESLINAFHKLKGSGKTYGIEEITKLGLFFETWLREGAQEALPHIEKSWALLQKIYLSRQKNQPFPIETDPEFLKLQQR